MAFVKAGFVVPPRTLVAGVPGKARSRRSSDQELAWKIEGTQELPGADAPQPRHDAAVAPLHCGEANRPRIEVDGGAAAVDAQGQQAMRVGRVVCAVRGSMMALVASVACLVVLPAQAQAPRDAAATIPLPKPAQPRSRFTPPAEATIPEFAAGRHRCASAATCSSTRSATRRSTSATGSNCVNCHLDAGRPGRLGAAVGGVRGLSGISRQERAGQHLRSSGWTAAFAFR